MAHTYDNKVQWKNSANPSSCGFLCNSGATVLVLNIFNQGQVMRNGGAPSYNGVTMTQVVSWFGGSGWDEGLEVWHLLDPPCGTTYGISIPNDSPSYILKNIASSYKASSGYTSVLDTISTKQQSSSVQPWSTLVTSYNGDAIIAALGNSGNRGVTARNGTVLYENSESTMSWHAMYFIQDSAGTQAASWTAQFAGSHVIAMASYRDYVPPPPIADEEETAIEGGVIGDVYFMAGSNVNSIQNYGLPFFSQVLEATFTSCKLELYQHAPLRSYTTIRDEVYISDYPILDRGESLTPYTTVTSTIGRVEINFTGLQPGRKYYANVFRYLDDKFYGESLAFGRAPFTIDNTLLVQCDSSHTATFSSGLWQDELTPYARTWNGAQKNFSINWDVNSKSPYRNDKYVWYNEKVMVDSDEVLGGSHYVRQAGFCHISKVHLDNTDPGGASISFKFRIGPGAMIQGAAPASFFEACWYSGESQYVACLYGAGEGFEDNSFAPLSAPTVFRTGGEMVGSPGPKASTGLERNTIYEFEIDFVPGSSSDTVIFKLDGGIVSTVNYGYKWAYPGYLWIVWMQLAGDELNKIDQLPDDVYFDLGPITYTGKKIYGNVDYSDAPFWESVTNRNSWALLKGMESPDWDNEADVRFNCGGLISGIWDGSSSWNIEVDLQMQYYTAVGSWQLRSPEIRPSAGYKYETAKIGGQQGLSGTLKIQFVDKNNDLISDDLIDGNSTGFFPSSFDIMSIDISAIPFTGIKAEVTGTQSVSQLATASPRLQLLSVSFTPGDLSGFSLDPVTSPTNITWQTITGDRAEGATITSTGDLPGVFFDTTSYTSDTTWLTVVRNLGYGDNQLTFRQDDGGVYSYEYGFITETGLAKRSLEAIGLDEKDSSRKLLSWIITEAMDLGELRSSRKFIAKILLESIGIAEKSLRLAKKVYQFIGTVAISEKDLIKKTIVAAIIDAFGVISDFVRSQFNTVLIGTPATVFVGNSPFTITKPTGVVSGDLLVATIVADTTSVIGWPANWVEDRTNTYGSNRISIGHKIATGSEPANYTFTATGATVAGISMVRLYNSISSYEYDDGNDSQYTTSNNQYPFPTISTDVSGEAIVYFAVELTGTPSATWPGTMELTDNSGVSMGAETFLNHGTSTQRSVTWSITSNNKIGIMGSYRAKSGLILLKTLIENISISENKKAMIFLRKIVVESLGITDKVLRNIKTAYKKILIETLSLTDKVLSAKAWRRVLLETVGITDKVLRFKAMSRILDEAVGISEKILRAIKINRISVEILSLVDLAGRLKGLIRGVVQTIDIAQNIVKKTSAFIKAIVVESISIAEKSLRIRAYFRRSVESLGLTEKAVRTRTMARAALDGIATADIVLRAEKLSRVILDAIGLSEVSQFRRSLRRVSSEAMGIADKVLKSISASIKRVLVEAVGISEKSLSSIHTLIRKATVEIVGLTEKALRSRTLSRVTAEVLAISDKVLDILTAAVAVIKTIIESLGISEKPVSKLLHIIKVVTVETVSIAQKVMWFSIGGLVDAVTAANRIFTAEADHIKAGLKSQINRFRAYVKNNILKGGE